VDSQTPRLLANQLRWDLTAEQIESMAAELTERTKLVYDRVGSQEQGEVSYENTLKALADVEVEYTGTSTEGEYWRSGDQRLVIKILLVFFSLCTAISFSAPLAPSAAWWVFFQLMFIQLDRSTKSRVNVERQSESKPRTALWQRDGLWEASPGFQGCLLLLRVGVLQWVQTARRQQRFGRSQESSALF